jgi:hypothetical protein
MILGAPVAQNVDGKLCATRGKGKVKAHESKKGSFDRTPRLF